MPSSRTNLTRTHLTLDEQSFQGLLSAAFTIQEHNDRRKQARVSGGEPGARHGAEANHLCPHCGSPKTEEASRCPSCGLEEFRPGERMQRNWASMWLMSQEQGLWLERPEEVDSGKREEPTIQASSKVANGGFLTDPVAARKVAREVIKKSTASDESEVEVIERQPAKEPAAVDASGDFRRLSQADSNDVPSKRKWPIKVATGFPEELPVENCDLVIQPLELQASDGSHSGPSYSRVSDLLEVFPADLNSTEPHSDDAHAIDTGSTGMGNEDVRPATGLQRFADLRVTLRFHRADLYLGMAVLVAIAALLWPAAVAPRRATLSLWDRALVAAGIAEAPAAAVHFQGDPGIEVWVDTHTALYYCPGTEAYGKTADGRLSSQREAQMDRFQPANRSACE
jgi:hypothetical protein